MENEIVDIGFISKDVTERARRLQQEGVAFAHFSPEPGGQKAQEKFVYTAETIEEFVALIKEPRQIRVEVYSWPLLNSVMEMLTPLLGEDDMLFDDALKMHQAPANL